MKMPVQEDKRDKPEAAKFIAEHVVAAGDSLIKIAQRYYKSDDKDKWMRIYEANKDVIGSDPSLIKQGQVLKIPKL
jgi:nucleoid-associated protein YgaU